MKGNYWIMVLTLCLLGCADKSPFPIASPTNSLQGKVIVGFWSATNGDYYESDTITCSVTLNYPNWVANLNLFFTTDEYDFGITTKPFLMDKNVVTLPFRISKHVTKIELKDQLGQVRTKALSFVDSNYTQPAPTKRFGHQIVTMPDPISNQKMFWMIGGNDGISALNDCWKSADGLHWSPVSYDTPFRGRYLHKVVVMDDPSNDNRPTLWMFGGFSLASEFSDIWKSVDGVNWEQVSPIGASFSARFNFDAVVMPDPNNNGANTMWVIGGRNGAGTRFNDVWKSTDGVHWLSVGSVTSIFTKRASHQTVTMIDPSNGKNTIWLIGGFDGTNNLNDIWKSSDGVNWFLVQPDGSLFSPRAAHRATALNFEGQPGIIVIGGTDGSGARKDVWMSHDGISWNQLNDESMTLFKPRTYHQLLVTPQNGREDLLMIGGKNTDDVPLSDVWKSYDGATFLHGVKRELVF